MSAPSSSGAARVRVALVGAGVIGSHHGLVLTQLSDRVELVAVVDHHLDRAEKLAAERGGRAFESLAVALDAVGVDVVVVCTPTGAHAEVAIEALDAGKHVVIEKPAEVTLARTDAIIDAQRRAGTVVTVISQHRFDPATEVALAAIRAGELGRLTSGIASIDWWRGQSYYDSGGWRGTWELDGGGALMNQGVHTVDLLVATMGRPVEVFAYTATLAHERIETEDVAVGVVRFESGALGVLHASTAGYPGLSARLQVHGDQGSVVIDSDRLTYFHRTARGNERREVVYGENPADNQVDSLGLQQGPAAGGTDPAQLGAAHRLQYENFLAALEGTQDLRVTLEENRRSIAVILGAYESARTGRPVSLA
ncbi:MAG TPA: Gfo/Idh/MocA family oxidoreductase [Pedococcus sp.]|jgi:predicted dehydrogenase|nr:Gfo/Idh/MocA family oxidoreductase [Pedococcus sp.]